MSRTITEIARILHDKVAWGLRTVDDKGNVIKDYPVDKDTRRIIVPASAITGTGDSNNNDSNNDNNNDDNTDNTSENQIPDVGVDTDPGHFLINRSSLWTGRTVTGQSNHVKLDKQITGVNGVGDGLQISVILERRTIKNGVSSDPVDVTLKSSTKGKGITGYFVTTSPVPISIETKNIIMGKKLLIPFDGIGENLDGVKVHQAPELAITYNSDGTFDFEDHQGWYLDKTGDGNNGATYNVIVTHINNYTLGPKVELLPNGTTLWEGNAIGGNPSPGNYSDHSVIALSHVNKDLTNVGSGLKIYFPEQIPYDGLMIPFDNLKLNVPNPWIIPFSQLDSGNILKIFSNLQKMESFIIYKKNDKTGKYDSMELEYPYDFSQNSLSIDQDTLIYNNNRKHIIFTNQTHDLGIDLPIVKVTSYQE